MKKFNDQLLTIGLESGHFVLASQQHSAEKFDFDAISLPLRRRFLFRRVVKNLGRLILETPEFEEVDIIVSVGNGANCLAAPVARFLERKIGHEVRPLESTYDEREGNKIFRLKRGNIYARGRRSVIIDDVYNHGTNMGKVAAILDHEAFRGHVLGGVVVLDRNPEAAEQRKLWLPESAKEVPVKHLIHHPIEDWPEERCQAELESRMIDPCVCAV